MKWLILLAFFSFDTFARVTLELGSPASRFSLNQSGNSRPVLSESASEFSMVYQYESSGAWTWGLGYLSQSMALESSANGATVEDDSASFSKISAYIARGSKEGLFAQLGIDNTTASYLSEEDSIIQVSDLNRMDIFLRFGLYYKFGYGGGEISYKYISIPGVSNEGQSLAGTGSEVYFNVFFNQNKNIGLYYRYTNEFNSGDYDHVFDNRTFGIILAY